MGGFKSSYSNVALGAIGPIPYLAIFAIIVGLFMWFLYNKTRHGKYMYAIGGNEAAAEVAGVNVYATKIRIYILASCMFGLAGCLLAAKSGGASVNTAQGYELDAIAAVALGGTSMSGGRGKIYGTFIGVLIIAVLNNGLNILGVSSYYQDVIKGLVILVAVLSDRKR